MQKLRYTTTIDAPREKVWETMLGETTYREWTSAFNPGGSYFEGRWESGSEIRFLGPDPESGEVGGMFSRIQESRPYEYVSIQHLGMIHNGEIDTTSDMVKAWTPAFETYTFADQAGGTEVTVETDTPEDFVSHMDDAWPQALEKLKALAESSR